MDKKVSVIIPVYNVEKYIEKCLNSVINQTLKDIEIIILNDGSTDKSEDIILKFLKIDSRIKYYKHENIGLGPTRNKGIEFAEGEYLSFVDSDDYISYNMLELLYETAKNENADVVCGQVVMLYENEKAILRKSLKDVSSYSLKTQDKEVFYREYYFGKLFSYNSCDKLYKTDLIKSNNIIFGDNKRIFAEDNFFQLQVLNVADIISFVASDIYYYLQRENSIMNSYKKNIAIRQLTMAYDYSKIISNDLQHDVCNLMVFEAIIMEVLNVIKSNNKFLLFYNNMNNFVRNNSFFKKRMALLKKQRSYRLEVSKSKRIFINIISTLEVNEHYLLSSIIIYIIYKIKNR